MWHASKVIDNQVSGQVMLVEMNILVGARHSQQRTLNLRACQIVSMHHTAIAMPALLGEVQAAVLVARELSTEGHKLKDAGRTFPANNFNSPVQNEASETRPQCHGHREE